MTTPQSRGARKSTGCCLQMAAASIMCCFAFGLVLGCSGPSGAEVAAGPARNHVGGIIDASALAEEQEHRVVVRRLLDGIVAGEDIAMAARWLPGVEFRESQAAFFAGNLLLRRWDFAPATRTDGTPVTLEFIPADDATANRIERRTYEVTGCRGAWVIDRVAAERVPQ